jgi:TetR/AcrR family transcriptional regulator, transcriptional repressor for nem operon
MIIIIWRVSCVLLRVNAAFPWIPADGGLFYDQQNVSDDMAKSRKDVTRRRIIETAGACFRRRGLSGIGIADLMKEAGLTHGGFYAHFASKDALVAEALRLASERLRSLIEEAAAAAPEGEKLMAVAARYLSSRHREHPENGCSIATLGPELGRESGAARRQFSANIQAAFERMAECSAVADREARQCEATGTFAAMVGGLILSRGVENPDEADRILADMRRFVRQALIRGKAPGRQRPPRAKGTGAQGELPSPAPRRSR